MSRIATIDLFQASAKSAPWQSTVSVEVLAILNLPALFEHRQPITLEHSYDVVIVGGGVAGLSAALSSARAGAKVLLLDKGVKLGAGASGRNAGILGAGVNMPITAMPERHPALALWQSTSELVHQIYEEAKQDGSLLKTKQIGALSLATTNTAVERLEHEAAARNKFNLDAKIITPDTVQSLTGDVLDLSSVKAALWLEDEGRINPLTLLAQRSQQARNAGALLVGQARVSTWSKEKNHWNIKIESSDFQSNECLTVKAKSLIVATGPLENPNARIYALSFAVDLAHDFPLFWDAAPFTYYDYCYGDGHLTVSGGRYGKAGIHKNDESYHEKMVAATRTWLPCLQSVEPSHTWAVDLHVTNDMIPEIEYFSESPCGLRIQGLGALGVLPGMVLGQRAGLEAVQLRV